MPGPFQQGEKRVFRLASGLTLNNPDLSNLATPDDWTDGILPDLFRKCISDESDIASTLTQIPVQTNYTQGKYYS